MMYKLRFNKWQWLHQIGGEMWKELNNLPYFLVMVSIDQLSFYKNSVPFLIAQKNYFTKVVRVFRAIDIPQLHQIP